MDIDDEHAEELNERAKAMEEDDGDDDSGSRDEEDDEDSPSDDEEEDNAEKIFEAQKTVEANPYDYSSHIEVVQN